MNYPLGNQYTPAACHANHITPRAGADKARSGLAVPLAGFVIRFNQRALLFPHILLELALHFQIVPLPEDYCCVFLSTLPDT